MAVKKHILTTGTDRFGGSDGKDLYVGSMLVSGNDIFRTLGSNDRLNGGKGIDTVRADLVSGLVVPIMKNIEIGVFTLANEFPVTLDLARVGQMNRLDLRNKNGIGDGSLTDTVLVQHAANVAAVSMSGVKNQTFVVAGIDSHRVAVEHVTFHDALFATLDLQTKNGRASSTLDVTLKNADFATITGDVAASTLRIHSLGDDGFKNGLVVTPDDRANNIRSVVIDGTNDLQIVNAFNDLVSFDASRFTGSLRGPVEIGGARLTTVLGGKGQDFINLSAIGGSAGHKAEIHLGAGDDYVDLTAIGKVSGKTLVIDGGSGAEDIAVFSGETHSIAGLLKGIENIQYFNLSGSYNLDDSHILSMQLTSPKADTVLNNIHDGFYLHCSDTQDWGSFTLTANMKNALASADETLTLNIYNSIVFGGPSGGFRAPHISNLVMNSFGGTNIAYLAQAGSADDPTTLKIIGSSHLDLIASNNSTSFITNLTITNTAGVDISGLAKGSQAFSPDGATIVGGDGDDVLISGAGADVIRTGGGNNHVYGSVGPSDQIYLKANSGLDVVHYTNKAMSPPPQRWTRSTTSPV